MSIEVMFLSLSRMLTEQSYSTCFLQCLPFYDAHSSNSVLDQLYQHAIFLVKELCEALIWVL